MARLSDKELIRRLLAKYQPDVRSAFLDAIQEIQDNVVLKVVVERLERHDIDGALGAMKIEPEAFGKVERSIEGAYNGGGQAFVENLPRLTDPSGDRVVWRFGVRDTMGEQKLRASLNNLTTHLTADMKEVARTRFSEGLAAGRNPTQTAVDVIGRMNRVTGKREGGVIGLSRPQERYVASARAELGSGNPKALERYLGRKRRDKRFDRTIRKAIREKKPIPKHLVDKITNRYSDGLLKLRGDAIGLNETLSATATSRKEAMRQQIENGKVDARDVTKTWHHSPEEHPRLNHLALEGQTIGFHENFNVAPGVMMDHPHDPDAPPHETNFCKCRVEYRINAIDALVRRMKQDG
ncbi:head morphogenesis protein [Pararhizobium mangrovi]|uniref:Head morphogenesis protein n=1 Tax=Pararhizobium mangrovi TaxID=2590452 RepID=A0A506TYH3_9HYPH|nr:head morphogenesis protein [Pararhizobium mangrovi]TPW26031.1 head morphogenesis protein [Pararhizobium mangrovi]